MVDRTQQSVTGTAIAAGQTDASVVAAQPSRRIRVTGVWVFPTTTPPASVTFNSKGSGAGTAISPVLPLVASTPLALTAPADGGLFTTNPGEALTVTNPAGTTLENFLVSYVVLA